MQFSFSTLAPESCRDSSVNPTCLPDIAAQTTFAYDALDHVTQVTDPKGLYTTYAYNGLGDLTTLTSPDTGTTTYTYDSAGNRATQTDARGVTATYSHDALNRLSSVVMTH